MKTIVLTGGGTAGHIMPHLALLPELKKHFNKIEYIGSFEGMEKDIIKKEGIPYHCITTTKLVRSFTFKNFCIPFQLFKGIKEAKAHLKTIKPNIVFTKGGFVSVPVVIAAKKLHIPIVSHESDITLGLANKIIARYANIMCFSFERTVSELNKKAVFTGSPICAQIMSGNKQKIITEYGLNQEKPTLLFVGGSLGAKAINDVVFSSIKELLKSYNVIHITGKNNKNNKLSLKNYVQIEFTSHIEDLFACADCVISRAGSNVIFELLALQKPMLLIPLSKKQSRGDQILNANYFRKKGYAKVLEEENLTKKSLLQKINQTLVEKKQLVSNMDVNNVTSGNENILKQILKYSK